MFLAMSLKKASRKQNEKQKSIRVRNHERKEINFLFKLCEILRRVKQKE